jgi:hypothetical protein
MLPNPLDHGTGLRNLVRTFVKDSCRGNRQLLELSRVSGSV